MAAYQSLYRRYRPQRFDEVLGQDHVTRALRNAVREGRVGHAYLFSGPRGTGKTSTARILAKVLNCDAPADGEPCGVCPSCVAVAEGRVVDWLLEQDAASKSKVDDMRDLLDRVPLGTSGRRKVIILDEVHMLSQGAENALLKTLEEPPEHVVFVLATTDPQKVRPTIRSRTQHFAFRLLSPDVLADHVRHVNEDSGLGLTGAALDEAVDHVIRSGGGSARDTLSALDQVAALGEVLDETSPIDAVLDALGDRDPGRVLVAVADALAAGHDPRALGEALIAALRNAFLAVMGVAEEHLAPADRERAARVGERLGRAGLTRALDVLGEALTELARKPDPRVVVEVALVRITQPDTDRTLDALVERVERLERTLAAGGAPVGAPGGVEVASGGGGGRGGTRGRSGGGRPADRAREALSGARGGGTDTSAPGVPAPAGAEGSGESGAPGRPGPTAGSTGAAGAPADAPAPAEAHSSAPATASGGGGAPPHETLVRAWSDQVLETLPKKVRSRWRGGRWLDSGGDGPARFAVPNSWHRKECEGSRPEVEAALAQHFGATVDVVVVVEGEADADRDADRPARSPGPGARAATTPVEARDDAGNGGRDVADIDDPDAVDHTELRDADDAPIGGVDLVLHEFGGELIEEEP
ncbi:MAG: DNA polymerase III subunit gamma/tau [Acidimicrobiia bacterium]